MRLKRIFDITVSAPALVASALPIVFVAAAMAIDTHAWPIFEQERLGKNGKPFNILKIRTMREAFNAAGELLPDRHRVSRLGVFIRKTHLDELPQFWNVLKGEMSIVGPRPLIEDIPGARHRVRQRAVPGMISPAAVKGANKLTRRQMLEADLAYVRDKSPLKDIKLILAWPFAKLRHIDAPHTGLP